MKRIAVDQSGWGEPSNTKVKMFTMIPEDVTDDGKTFYERKHNPGFCSSCGSKYSKVAGHLECPKCGYRQPTLDGKPFSM